LIHWWILAHQEFQPGAPVADERPEIDVDGGVDDDWINVDANQVSVLFALRLDVINGI